VSGLESRREQNSRRDPRLSSRTGRTSVFKYLKRKYADQLLTMGTIRVGTLSDFQKVEHARGVADPNEGKKLIVHDVEDEFFVDPKDATAFNEFSPIKIAAPNIQIVNLRLQNKQVSPDCFVLCLSSECSEAVRREFDGVDACVQINNSDGFIAELTALLHSFRSVELLGVHACRYKKRREEWNGFNLGTHPALIKEPRFRGQKEIRVLWRPLSPDPIQPMVFGSVRLPKFCKDVTSELR
jgi:hypothetical protein